jgi:hypothetical protein
MFLRTVANTKYKSSPIKTERRKIFDGIISMEYDDTLIFK